MFCGNHFRRTATVAIGAALGLAISTANLHLAHGQHQTDHPQGQIVYGKGYALWRTPARGGESVKIAELGFAAKRLTKIVANTIRGNGSIFLVSTENNHYWVATQPDQIRVIRHVCRGHAVLSADGRCVLCQDRNGTITLERLLPTAKKVTSKIRGDLASLLGDHTRELVVVTKNGVEAVNIAKPTQRRLVAGVAPVTDLLVAPNGKHAVAVFGESQDRGTGLYVFTLSGDHVRRKLVSNAIPVVWSSDSRWLVVTRKQRGCVVRASGGQYRCFAGFRAIGLAPDFKEVLLTKGKPAALTLFRADLGGAHSRKPIRLHSGVQGAAIWLP